VPAGLLLQTPGVAAACAEQGLPIYLEDAPSDSRYLTPTGRSYAVEFALPIFERDSVVAVLNIEREEPFSSAERHTLELFVDGVSERLTERSKSSEANMIAELSTQLAGIESLEDAAAIALDVIMPLLGARAGTILSEQPGYLQPLAVKPAGLDPERRTALSKSVPYSTDLLWKAVLTGEVQFIDDHTRSDPDMADHDAPRTAVILVHPISQQDTCRTVVTLHLDSRTDITEADIALLATACRHLAIIFNIVQTVRVQDRLLDLQTLIAESGTHQLYQQILETAIALTPGAEAGTLLVRRTLDEPFQYQAAVGHDLEALQKVQFSERQMRSWHGLSDAEWLAGELRILDSSMSNLEELSIACAESEEPARVGQLRSLRATASLPVVYRSHVMAALNLDNFTRMNAFGEDSLRTLRLFKAPVASMLQAAHHRDAIVRYSLTDPVTNLPNRRDFEGELERMLARSLRSREPFTLFMMDMAAFKVINDTLGHHSGDEALQAVARTLMDQRRTGDVVARWGGDEFTALLPGVDSAAAAPIARRFQAAVAQVQAAGIPLGIDLGIASYPVDGWTGTELLRAADKRMYLDKENRRRIAEPV
jgi:diguanylate cyclase (GGDEF)-like protein